MITKRHIMKTKHIWAFILLFAFFLSVLISLALALSQDPSPVSISGRVLYNDEKPAEGITVAASWLTFEGEKIVQTKTFSLKEARSLGSPELAGNYIFLSGQISQKKPIGVTIKSGQSSTYISLKDDNPIKAPDIILDSEEMRAQEKGFFERARGFVYSILGMGSSLNSEGIEEDSSLLINSALNIPPSINGLPDNVYLCGNQSLDIFFNITGDKRDNLTIELNPKYPFNIYPESVRNASVVLARIYSDALTKDMEGLNELAVVVSNEESSIDYKKINITVFGQNHPPQIGDIEPITLETGNDNKVFYMQVKAYDEEDGNQDMRNLHFNLTFLEGRHLFDISQRGTINAGFNKSDARFYHIQVCAADKGIKSLSDSLSLCDQDKGSKTSCKDFTLTIVEKNHEPEIVSFYPDDGEDNIEYSGNDFAVFNVTKEDADGNVPLLKWYVDKELIAADKWNRTSQLNHQFGCDAVGNHTVKAEISDGLLMKYIDWKVNITDCPREYALDISKEFFNSEIKDYEGRVKESRHSWKYWGIALTIVLISAVLLMLARMFVLKKRLEKMDAIKGFQKAPEQA